MDSQARLDELLTRLREQGYRLTPQRVALVQLLIDSKTHPSAGQIYEQLHAQFPTMSLATVYKTLHLLKEMGEVLELGFGDDDNRYDASDPDPHPHLVCIRCRKIIDPDVPVFETLAQEVAAASGYHILSHRLDFFGICPACQEEAAEN